MPREHGTYDLVVCQALLTHLSRPEEALREMVRLVRPGGLVGVIEPDLRGAIEHTIDPHIAPSLRAELNWRLREATAGARHTGVGTWDVVDHLEGLLSDAGLVDVFRRTEPGRLRLAPPYDSLADALRNTLLVLDEEDAARAEGETMTWLATEGGAQPERLAAIETAVAGARRARRGDLRNGTWTGTVAHPLTVGTGRRPAGSV